MKIRDSKKVRAIRKALLVFMSLLIFGATQALANDASKERIASSIKEPYIIGHRGAAGLAPENTMAAFKQALDLGVDAVELDVHIASDGTVVVYHDFTLQPEITRKPDGEWLDMWTSLPIISLSLDEIKKFDVGRLDPYSAYASRYPDQISKDGERIPTLKEVMELFQNRESVKTQLWIEIKTSPEKEKVSSRPETVAKSVVALVKRERFAERAKILSFDWRTLIHIQRIAPDLSTVYLSSTGGRLNNIKPGHPGPSPWTSGFDIDDFNGSIPRAIKAAGGSFWAPRYNQVTSSSIKEAHRLGLKVFVWTVDRRKDMARLIEMGVDGIITNRPDILKSVMGGS